MLIACLLLALITIGAVSAEDNSDNLTVSDINYIIYWTKDLEFSVDLVYYLVEYCIDKGHPSIKYMDSIALDWASHNISSIEQAKEDTLQHSKAYYNVCKSFGIKNRGLIKSEIEYVQKWSKLGLGGEVIEEALLLEKTDDNTNDQSSTSETVAHSATNSVIHQQMNFTGNNNAGIVINGGTINF